MIYQKNGPILMAVYVTYMLQRLEYLKEGNNNCEDEVKSLKTEFDMQLGNLKEANRKAEDDMKSLKDDLDTMQDLESENGIWIIL